MASVEIEQLQEAMELGAVRERARILKLWEAEMECSCEEPMQHLAKLIKGNDESWRESVEEMKKEWPE